jgi:hypothetical protein
MAKGGRELKTLKTMDSCPICLNGRFLNRISQDGFFCACCLNEFKVKGDKKYLMEINEANGEAKPTLLDVV